MIITYLFVIIASVVVGFINTLVGSGSLIMLPIYMAMGLPANVANGTNRVAVFFQCLMGTATFFKNQKYSIWDGRFAVIPCVLGAMLGAWLASEMSPEFMKDFIGILMILMLGIVLIDQKKWIKEMPMSENKSKTVGSMLLMFVIGMYGGFIQAGIGIFLLAGLVLGLRFDMRYSNFLKIFIVFAYAFFVLVIFGLQGQIDWFWGLFTSVGQMVGAYLGASFAIHYKKADVWTYRLMILVIVGSIIQFYGLWKVFI